MTPREAKNEDILRQIEKDIPSYCKEQRCAIHSYTDWYDAGGGRDGCKNIPACSDCPEGCDPEICSLRKLDVRAYEIVSIKDGLEVVNKLLSEVKEDNPFGNLNSGRSNLEYVIKQISDLLKTA